MCCFHTPKTFYRSFKELKISFLDVSFYPLLWGKVDSPPCFILKIFTTWSKWVITYNVCVIYPNRMIYPQYSFMHYAQFFQELYWVLTRSVSLCPVLRYLTSENLVEIMFRRVKIFDGWKFLQEPKNLPILRKEKYLPK